MVFCEFFGHLRNESRETALFQQSREMSKICRTCTEIKKIKNVLFAKIDARETCFLALVVCENLYIEVCH